MAAATSTGQWAARSVVERAVIGDSGDHLRHDVARRGHDQHEVRPVREKDVRYRALGKRVEVIGHGMLRECLEGRGANEPLGVGGHDHAHVAVGLLQFANHLARLVGGYAPGHGEKDVAGGAHCHSPTSSVTIILWQ